MVLLNTPESAFGTKGYGMCVRDDTIRLCGSASISRGVSSEEDGLLY